jgi:hypothetical protein
MTGNFVGEGYQIVEDSPIGLQMGLYTMPEAHFTPTNCTYSSTS